VAIGTGARTNPLIGGQDIPLVLVPHVSYYRSRFFLDDLDLGFSLVESAANTLSLVASPGCDRVYFYRTDLQNFFITGYLPNGAAIYTLSPALGTSTAAGGRSRRGSIRARKSTGSQRRSAVWLRGSTG
jgi:outer membrane protein